MANTIGDGNTASGSQRHPKQSAWQAAHLKQMRERSDAYANSERFTARQAQAHSAEVYASSHSGQSFAGHHPEDGKSVTLRNMQKHQAFSRTQSCVRGKDLTLSEERRAFLNKISDKHIGFLQLVDDFEEALELKSWNEVQMGSNLRPAVLRGHAETQALQEIIYGKEGSWKERTCFRLRCHDKTFWKDLWLGVFPDLWHYAEERGWIPDPVTLPLPPHWDAELRGYQQWVLDRLRAIYAATTSIDQLKPLNGGLHKYLHALDGHLVVLA